MALSIGGGKLTKNGIEAAKEFIPPMMRVADGAGDGEKPAKGTVALSAEIEDGFVRKSVMANFDRCELAGSVIGRGKKHDQDDENCNTTMSHDFHSAISP